MWHLDTTLPGYTSSTRAVSDAGLIATTTWDYITHVIDIASGREVAALVGHTGIVRSVEFVAGGRQVFTLSETYRRADDDSRPAPLSPEDSLRFSHRSDFDPRVDYRGRFQGDGTARLWDARSGRSIFELETEHLYRAICSQDGRYFAVSTPYDSNSESCCGAKNEIWNTNSACRVESTAPFQLENCILLTFASDRGLLFILKQNTIEAWAFLDGTRRFVIRTDPFIDAVHGQFNRIWSLTIDPSQSLAAVAFEKQPVEIWNLERQKRIATLCRDTVNTSHVAFSHDGQIVMTGAEAPGVRIHQACTGKSISAIEMTRLYSVDSVAISPDGCRALIQPAHEPATLCDTTDGSRLAVLTRESASNEARSREDGGMTPAKGLYMPMVHFAPTGHLITNGNNCPRVWSFEK